MNENAKKWVEALRSGEYEQGKSRLCKEGKYCCLGVACDLYTKEGNELQVSTTEEIVYYGEYEEGSLLPSEVQGWLGLKHKAGCYNSGLGYEKNVWSYDSSLTLHNDAGLSFSAIADIIESEPEGLFVN